MSKTNLRPKISGSSLFIMLPLTLLLTACGQKYSPDTYSSNAVQQASKVVSGVVVGVRKVAISADPTVASATGAAAGGIAGSQVAEGAYSALGALGGAVVGGLAGSEAGHKIQDTFGYEYIVRNANGDLLSVTQKDTAPLKIGQRVLLIQGSQARIVNDYTEHVETDREASSDKKKSAGDHKPDMSKSAGNQSSDDIKTPAPAMDSQTEQMTKAAIAAALAALAVESMSNSKDKPAAATTTNSAPADAATTPAPAEPDNAASEATPTSDKQDAAPAASSEKTEAPKDEASANAALQQPGEKPVPAPASTIIVPAPTQTDPVTAPAAAPATAPGAKGPEKDKATSKDKAASDKADKAASDDEAADQPTSSEGQAEASDAAESDKGAADKSAPPAPAKKDEGNAH